jgi:hypothetical protein
MNSDGNRGGHPDVSDEDIGRRTVEIRREKAVERAIELLRKHLGARWSELSVRDVERLHWTLGQSWGHMSRVDWDAISFSALEFEDIEELLAVSAELSNATYGHTRYLDRLSLVLNGTAQAERKAAAEAAAAAAAEDEGL